MVRRRSEESDKENRAPRKRNKTSKSNQKKTQTSKTGKSSKKSGKKKANEEDSEDMSLYDIVAKSQTDITYSIDKWIKSYISNAASAVLELVNFIVKSCGCDAEITPKQYKSFESETADANKILKRLGADEVERDRGLYPIISKAKDLKRFRTNFQDFWKKLLFQCQREIIYDSYFLETILAWLVVISQSPVRAFRHTATVAALQIKSSIVTITSQQQKQLAVNARQLQAERRKAKKSSKTKVAGLTETCYKMKENIAHLENLMNEIVEGLYNHRYRDVNPLIRSDCVAALGEWIMVYPSFFLNNNFLKRIGFALSDKAQEVRYVATTTLKKMYASDEHFPQLDLFTAKFKSRMLELLEDKHIPTAVAGIQLCSELANRDILGESDINDVYSMLSDYDTKVRQATGDFVVDYLLENVVVSRVKSKMSSINAPKRTEEKELAISQICQILELIQQKTQHTDLPDYTVDVLWGRVDVLRDWETMINLLVDPPPDIVLSRLDQVLLAKLLTACVRRAHGESIVPKLKSDPHYEDSEKILQKNIINFTEQLINTLPSAMEKYITDPDSIIHLSQIPRYFVLDMYGNHGLEKYFNQLLEKLEEAMLKTTHEEAMKNIAITLNYLKTQNHKQQTDANVTIINVVEKSYKTFKRESRKLRDSASKSGSHSVSEESESTHSENYNPVILSTCLQRLNSFHSILNIETIIKDNYFDELEKILVSHEDGGNFPVEVILQTTAACQYSLLWAVAKIDPTDTNRKEQEVISLKAKRFLSYMENFIDDPSPIVREDTFFRLSDCLLLFNRTLRSYSLTGLAYKPSKKFVHKIKHYFQTEMNNDFLENPENLYKEEEGEIPITEKQNIICLRKSKLIAALGKLVAYGVFPGNLREHAPDILIHFVEHGRSVAETIKAFLSTIRKCVTYDFDIIFHTLSRKYDAIVMELEKSGKMEISQMEKPNFPETMENSQLEEIKDKEDVETEKEKSKKDKKQSDKEEGKTGKKSKKEKDKREIEEVMEFKKYISVATLAKRLADSYGIYSQRTEEMRVSLANLVGECISWVVFNVEERQPFLTYVAHFFVSKLDALAAKSVLDHLDSQIEGLDLSESDEKYKRFFKFRESLKTMTVKGGRTGKPKKKTPTKATDTSVPPSDVETSEPEKGKTGKKKGGKKRKSKRGEEDQDHLENKKKKTGKKKDSSVEKSQPEKSLNENSELLEQNRKKKGKRKSDESVSDIDERKSKKSKLSESTDSTSSESKKSKRKYEDTVDDLTSKKQKTNKSQEISEKE